MTKHYFALGLLSVSILACQKGDEIPQSPQEGGTPTSAMKLSQEQALAYARLFSPKFTEASHSEAEARALQAVPQEVDHVSYYVEGGDTLLYSINYKDGRGFVVLSADNSAFPIIAHSDEGSLDVSKLDRDTPLGATLHVYSQNIKNNLRQGARPETEYYTNWKDLGNKDYQYEIELANMPPPPSSSELRSRRRESTNRELIQTSTGNWLKNWHQHGNFRSEMPNNALVGCPALSIGMLMYDFNHRPGRMRTLTTVPISRSYMYATDDNQLGRELSKVLRRIADSIPNYNWGERETSATLPDILAGLYKLGFQEAKAEPFDIDLVYKNLSGELHPSQKGLGVLLAAGHNYKFSGHIWFCDGYYEQSYRVRKKFLFITTKTWYEYEDRLYMNWGWGADGGNGWFNANGDAWHSDGKTVEYKRQAFVITGLQEYNNPDFFVKADTSNYDSLTFVTR